VIYWIPTSTRLSDYTQTVRLGGADYRIRLAWAERERRWFFDLWTGDGTPLVAGKKVVADRCLNRLVTSSLGPPGGIWCFDTIQDWDQFALDLLECPDLMHRRAEQFEASANQKIDQLADAGADFIMLAYDVAFNAGPFISPAQFREFVTPYLARQCARVRQRGSIPMFHSDGMMMPILDQLVEAGPAAFQSVDPMAGMDIAEVKCLTYGKMALMGNVRCDYLQHGPPEAIRQSARYCLEHGAPGGGYIFSTSNTVFDGVPLANYELMLDEYRRFCHGMKP
jgi:uroporphyrinogen-III decarboxylase